MPMKSKFRRPATGANLHSHSLLIRKKFSNPAGLFRCLEKKLFDDKINVCGYAKSECNIGVNIDTNYKFSLNWCKTAARQAMTLG